MGRNRRKVPDNTVLYFIFGLLIVLLLCSISSTAGTSVYVISEIDQYEGEFSNKDLDENNKVYNYCQTKGVCFDGLIGWYDIISFSENEYKWYDKSKEATHLVVNKKFADKYELIRKAKSIKKEDDLTKEEQKLIEEYLDLNYSTSTVEKIKELAKEETDKLLLIRKIKGAQEKSQFSEEDVKNIKKFFNVDLDSIELYKLKEEAINESETTIEIANKAVTGTKIDTIEFPDEMFTKSDNYTFIHVANYWGNEKKRIFQSSDINYTSGFWNGYSGMAFQDTPIAPGVTNYDGALLSIEHRGEYARNDGEFVKKTSGFKTPKKVGVNVGKYPNEYGNFQIFEILVYNRKLTNDEISKIKTYLNDQYYVLSNE